MFIYLNRLFISLVAMDTFCKSYGATNLASLHYVTFIEPFAILPMEAMPFDFEYFRNNSIDKMIDEKIDDPFLLLEEHFFATVLLHKKTYEVQFEDISHEVFEFFSEQ
jgi:hypothetical protein